MAKDAAIPFPARDAVAFESLLGFAAAANASGVDGRELLEALPAAVYTTDAEGRLTFYNRAAVDFWGYEPVLGEQLWCGSWKLFWSDGTPLAHGECPMAIAIKENRPVRGMEAVAERPDGQRVPFIPYPTPLRDSAGKVTGAINMLVDISERKHAEDRQKALVDELNHRVKNTLATVQSLAWRSARGVDKVGDFWPVFEARLLALSRAHDQLTRRVWEDAGLADILEQELAPYETDGQRVRLAGPAVALKPRTALTLAMVFHELTTNAVKYGALSSPAGQVEVAWTLDGEAFDLTWRESGGPPVSPPDRVGFGSTVLTRGVRQELAGEVELDFAPDGLHCRIRAPF